MHTEPLVERVCGDALREIIVQIPFQFIVCPHINKRWFNKSVDILPVEEFCNDSLNVRKCRHIGNCPFSPHVEIS